jgi:hypothetical protein
VAHQDGEQVVADIQVVLAVETPVAEAVHSILESISPTLLVQIRVMAT